MRPIDPILDELRASLQRLGYVVVPHGDHLCVRLSLFSSVRVRHDDGRLDMRPQFGPFSRTGGLLATSGVATGAVAASAFAAGLSPLTAIVAFLGVVGLAHDACRYVITEGAITRLQLLAASAQSAALDAGERDAIPTVARPELPPASPARSPGRPDVATPLRPPSRRTLP